MNTSKVVNTNFMTSHFLNFVLLDIKYIETQVLYKIFCSVNHSKRMKKKKKPTEVTLASETLYILVNQCNYTSTLFQGKPRQHIKKQSHYFTDKSPYSQNNGFSKETFHDKIGSIKDRNGMDLTETEEIKKRWQE